MPTFFAAYTDRSITFEDVLAVRDAITARYRKDGYLTSGAIVPPQPLQDGVVEIQIVEGSVEDIIIEGTNRLQPEYVSSRLGLGAQAPLQIDALLEQLQLLQLNPLIDTISADLQAGTRPGTNLLVVTVTEADSFAVSYTFDNSRSPSVGSLRHQIGGNEGNLTGYGDALSASFALTEGSQDFDLFYAFPVSPHNTLVSVYYSATDSDVIEEPFDILAASSEATVLEFTVQHPLVQTPTEDVVLGLIGSHQRTQTFLGIDDIGGFPLSAGADDQGRTRVTALRFFSSLDKAEHPAGICGAIAVQPGPRRLRRHRERRRHPRQSIFLLVRPRAVGAAVGAKHAPDYQRQRATHSQSSADARTLRAGRSSHGAGLSAGCPADGQRRSPLGGGALSPLAR